VGVGIYAASEQHLTTRLGGNSRVAAFVVRVTNRGDSADWMTILGIPRNRSLKVAYLVGGQDVTRAVRAGTYAPTD
jgi:hypothetical protein